MPLDGENTLGTSRFDTSILTGEAAPRAIAVGTQIKAGFVNLSNMIEVRVTAPMSMRRIDRMGIDIATELHARPEIHRLAQVIVPLALTLTALTLLWGLGADLSGEAAGLRALCVLIIACPYAAAIAAPVSHLAATGAEAASGTHFRMQAAEGMDRAHPVASKGVHDRWRRGRHLQHCRRCFGVGKLRDSRGLHARGQCGGVAAVSTAIDFSRKARAVLRQNLVFSVVNNAAALSLGVLGTVPPLAAAGRWRQALSW